ncbi:type II CAAX endopeptidase family protein [Temperatibacter marinus]|uniref:Type II CAAX endopeptidase family protein n=1 Tax=Temperatibacter marinus TaxID=1456591 RepID=A0AA52EG76_9PROT|nr:type II CAAX endopeptidase family protein [Temperatibacter marinus]WND01496.1 type II CAAX endopeptidase family protein [Temperatibacter marinus]
MVDVPTDNSTERQEAWRNLVIFMLIMIGLSAVYNLLMINMGQMSRMLVAGVMWAPGIAALLTCLIIKRKISDLPWGWGEWKWNWMAWWLPIVYGTLIYAPIWLFQLGDSSFPNPKTLADWSSNVIGTGETNIVATLFFVLLLASFGVIASLSRALGEEIGWRGFMIWEMRKVMSFGQLAVLSGLIWGMWHWPAILFTDYNNGEGNFYLQLALFTVSISAMGPIYAYLTFKSKSLWPAAILHASHNLFIQGIFTPLTQKGAETHLYVDEFGVMMPIVVVMAALYFWRRAKREGM